MSRPSKSNLPVWGVLFAFLLTVVIARWLSSAMPGLHLTLGGVHVHHYVYGVFILTAAGYLALVFKGPRATSWIALLYGLGVGLTFDEFGFWFNPPFQRGVRWEYRGLVTVVVALLLVSLVGMLQRSEKGSRPLLELNNEN